MNIRQKVEEYTAAHPEATCAEVSAAIEANPKTVYVYMKGYNESRGNVGGPAKKALVKAPTPLDMVRKEIATIEASLSAVKPLRERLTLLREMAKQFEVLYPPDNNS